MMIARPSKLLRLASYYESQLIVVHRAEKLFELYKTSGDAKSAEFYRIELEAEIDKLNGIGRQIPLPDYVPNIDQAGPEESK